MSRLKSNDELYELVKHNLTKNLPITINRVGGVEYTFAQYCYNNGFGHLANINAHLKMMAKHPGYFDKNNDINNAKYYIELFVDVMKKPVIILSLMLLLPIMWNLKQMIIKNIIYCFTIF
nr:ankyrin repeat domain containing protein [Mimivirus sp.]